MSTSGAVFSPLNASSAVGLEEVYEIDLEVSGPHGVNPSNPSNAVPTVPSSSTNTNTFDSLVAGRPVSLSPGHSTVFGASFNFINSIVGAGIIGIPLAIQQCGFIIGMVLLLLVAYFIYSSVVMLITCGIYHNVYDLEELADKTLGQKGFYMALLSMFLFAYGGQVAYLVIIGDSIPLVALYSSNTHVDRDTCIALFATLVILPLCLFRDLSHLAWTSLLSIVLEVILLLLLFIAAW